MNLNVDFELKQGTFNSRMAFNLAESSVGVFGPSGAGKSTLFRVLTGLTRPQHGRVILDGEVLFDAASRTFLPPHRRGIGLVFQDARLFPHWSVERNLRAGEVRLKKTSDRPFTFDDVVELLAVKDLLKRSVTSLSGGERQRMALGRSLLSNPRLLLMDEPVTGLDARLKAHIMPFLVRVVAAFGIPCMYISHDLAEIQQLTDYLVLVNDGEARQQGVIRELIKQPGMLRRFVGARLLNIMKMTVISHEHQDGVTMLSVENRKTTEPIVAELWEEPAPASPVTVGIAPTEIALALHRIEGSSIQNQWAGCVEQVIHAPDRSLCLVDTDVGQLMVDISPRSERDLNLKPGKKVICLLKAKAIQRTGSVSEFNDRETICRRNIAQ
jgi:molybdate transport system ATP-binding protein